MEQTGPLISVVILEVKVTDSRTHERKERSANPPPPLGRTFEALCLNGWVTLQERCPLGWALQNQLATEGPQV